MPFLKLDISEKRKEHLNMKLIALPYCKFQGIEMEILDKLLLEASGEEVLKNVIQSEPKLKSIATYIKLKGKFKEGAIEEIALNMENYFNVYKVLGNQFLENHSKKYEQHAKDFVMLTPEKYEEFLKKFDIENELPIFITMIRFLKQNNSYSKQIEYLLNFISFKKQQNTVAGAEDKLKLTDEYNIQERMHGMLDEIFSLMGDPEEMKALKNEMAIITKKSKALEKKVTGQTKELEATKQSLIQERALLKDARTTISNQSNQLDNSLLELEKLKNKYDDLQQEVVKERTVMDTKVTSHKNELKSLEELYKKKLESELTKITDEKSNLQMSILKLEENVADLMTSNDQLQNALSKNETEKEALIVQIGLLKNQLNDVTKNETEITSTIQTKVNNYEKSAKNSKGDVSVKIANSELLKSVGFGTNEANIRDLEVDSDLFDIDDNAPSFD